MEQQRREPDKSVFIKIISWVVGICVTLLTVIGALITFIYTTHASETNTNVAEIATNVQKLVNYNITNREHIKNNEAKIDSLNLQLAALGVKIEQHGNNITILCAYGEPHWPNHVECKK